MFLLRNRLGRGWRVIAALLLAVALLSPTLATRHVAAQALLPATATAAPESTVFYHQVNLDREGGQWQQVEKLLARVGVPDALDLWESELLAEGGENGDFTEADLDALLGGEMAVVVTPPAIEHLLAMMAMMEELGGQYGKMADGHAMDGTPIADDAGMMGTPTAGGLSMEGPIGVAAVLLPGDGDAAWSYVQRQFAAAAAEGGTTVESESYDGSDVLVIEGMMSQHAAKKKQHGEMNMDMGDWMGGYPLQAEHGLAAARAGAFIVAGMTRDDVVAIVDVIHGERASLAESREAQRVRAQLPARLLSFTYVDGPALTDAFGAEMMAAWADAFPDMNMNESEAHEGIGIGALEVGFRFDTIAIPGEGSTLPQAALENNPDILTTAERAPANTFLFNAGALAENAFAGAAYVIAAAVNGAAGGETWDESAMMMEPPSAEEVAAEIDKASATLGFNPQSELVDYLGREFIVFASLPSITMGGFGWDALAAITATDASALAETTQKLAAFIERSDETVEISTRQVGGDTVYVTGMPDMGEAPAIEFGVVAGQLAVGMGAGIDDLAGDPASSLAEDAQFQEVMNVLPGEAYQIGYVDFGQLVDLVTVLMSMGQDEPASATPVADDAGSPENIRALGAAAFVRGGNAGTSAVLYIAGGE